MNNIKTHPAIWITTTFVVVTYLALCVFVNPPFITFGDYDRSLIDSRITDALALILGTWILLFGFILKRLKVGPRVMEVWVWGIYALFLILAVALFHKGYNSTDLVIKKHWLGQGIGILGLGWLVVLIPLIKVFKCEHAPPAGRGEAPRP